MTTHRRRFLHLCSVAGIGALAGCTSESEDPPSEQESTNSNPQESSPTSTEEEFTGPLSAQIFADDGENGDGFADAVAVSDDGTTVIIGAYRDPDPNGDLAGSAYVFDATGGEWTQQAKLSADDGDSDDFFGRTVDVSSAGNTVLIGAGQDDDPNGSAAGSAYVFTRSGTSWTQQAKLAADDGDSDDDFGEAVALSADGSTAVIGAKNDEDPNGFRGGSTYVFTHASGSWSQQAKLSPDGGERHRFGGAVDVSSDGTIVLIGASTESNSNGTRAGSAYIFQGEAESWTQERKLIADDGDKDDRFGGTVALSSDGTMALVGARDDADPHGNGAGSAYTFVQSDGSWRQQTKLIADDGDSGDGFGHSVAITNDGITALIGTPDDQNSDSEEIGSVYVFERSGSSWTQQTTLDAEESEDSDEFGTAVSISSDGTTAVIGTAEVEGSDGNTVESAFVFSL